MSEASLPHGFQYSSARHEAETAFCGMWLFLATEILFFGPLFLAWIYCRHFNQSGFDAGATQTNLLLGTINTALLVTSSFAYSLGLAFMERGERRRLAQCCVVAWMLGASFLALKFGVEWREDFARDLFPGASFSIEGAARSGAQLFFVFYFVSTAIHGAHMVVGLLLVGWVIARAGKFTAERHDAVVVVGLYWSFVDMIWVFLYPLIYLIGRGA
jgi:cytochrome c oxidase subunit III